MRDQLEEYAESKGHEDLAALKKHIPWLFRLGSNREMRRLVDHLHEDELVLSITSGKYAGGRGLITLTDSRLIVTYDGYIRSASEDFPLEQVTSIEWNKKLFRGRIVVFSAGNEAEMRNVYHGGRELVLKARTSMRKVKNQVEQTKREQQMRAQHAPSPLAPPPLSDSPVFASPRPTTAPSPAASTSSAASNEAAQLALLDELLGSGKIPYSYYTEARAKILG